MVATASFCCSSDALPAFFDFSDNPVSRPIGRFRGVFVWPAAAASIKVLNLLTNRYLAGVVRESSKSAVSLDLPRNSNLQPGQRVRFIVATDQALVARRQMQSAIVTHIDSSFETCHVKLELLHEVAAA